MDYGLKTQVLGLDRIQSAERMAGVCADWHGNAAAGPLPRSVFLIIGDWKIDDRIVKLFEVLRSDEIP